MIVLCSDDGVFELGIGCNEMHFYVQNLTKSVLVPGSIAF